MYKKILLCMMMAMVGVSLAIPVPAAAYNFGDYRSVTLITNAWQALGENDLEAVLAYTNKCVELYAEQAKKMQASLTAYPTGTNDEIFSYWALNDIATGLFIQGEAYRKAKMTDEAVKAYQTVVDEYTYGQCWDPKGWFWKPAEASKEKIAMIESGSNLDFGDYTSMTLTVKGWEALANKDLDSVIAYTNKCLELYEAKAKEMQESMTEYAWESKDKIFSYWALNDVGTCLFIRGEAYLNAGNKEEAKKNFKKLVDDYYFSQCWDPKGWFWKPAEGAQQKLEALEEE
ncbi:MAG TPA: tetratricopeptide repeat protein [Candidatus Omnitrophota bacterium]|nr:tetratricopeptide repeat protein [Candidatus Omnitrophota bacterium]HQO57773.1 tetratricopeptide repeat protein [Candidatus Omnitrophota bacterium]